MSTGQGVGYELSFLDLVVHDYLFMEAVRLSRGYMDTLCVHS